MPDSHMDWDFIVEQIDQKKFVPIIGNQVIQGALFDTEDVVQAWADSVGYPLGDGHNLTRVAQFLSSGF